MRSRLAVLSVLGLAVLSIAALGAWAGWPWPTISTASVVAAALGLLMTDTLPADAVLLGGVIVLASVGVISPDQALAGFANTGMLTVAALFVLAAGLERTGAVALLLQAVLGRPRSERAAILQLSAPVVGASAFLNNTTIVAMLLPAVTEWSKRIGVAPSRLLMPLSFAAILGGTCTLIGTSTNLVVSGLVMENLDRYAGLHPIAMFELTPLGIPVALAGLGVMVLFVPRLLPTRKAAVSRNDDPRQYTMEVLIPDDSVLRGKSVEEAGLRNLPGAFVMEIVREGNVLSAVSSHEPLQAGDRLVLVGDVTAMVEILKLRGLAPAADQLFRLEGQRRDRRIVEAVVAKNSPLVGRSIRESRFRQRYRAVVIAVARASSRVPGRLGDVVLQAGDLLLLEAHPDFVAEQRRRSAFYLVGPVEGASTPQFEKATTAAVLLGLFVLGASFELISPVVAAFLAAGAMILTGCLTIDDARRAIDVQVLVAIAAAFGLGTAMQETGLDQRLTALGFSWVGGTKVGALILVYVATAVLTEVITNNAAAVLALPLALAAAQQVGASPMPFVIAVTMAASASFLTPIGYQTNLMVQGPGSYRPSDYLRLGLPVSLTVGVVTVTLIPLLWPL